MCVCSAATSFTFSGDVYVTLQITFRMRKCPPRASLTSLSTGMTSFAIKATGQCSPAAKGGDPKISDIVFLSLD